VHGRAAAPLVGAVALDVDGALPVPETPTSALLASSVRVGGDDHALTYRASYAIDSGDVLASNGNAVANPPTRFGGQSLVQSVELRTPELAGAPLALHLSRESRDDWTVSGRSRQQHALADLSWSPAGAAVDLQWVDAQQGVDPALGLTCSMRGSVQVPMTAQTDGTQTLRFSGRRCQVLTADSRYAALGAQTWKIARLWSAPDREGQVLLSVVDPLWLDGAGTPPLAPSYELAVGLRRSYGPWSAAARASVRGRSDELQGLLDGPTWSDGKFAYATDTSFTRRLAEASVSASWAHDADPLWFVPALGQHTDRFGVALDLSAWALTVMPAASPRLALSWNWWEAHSPAGDTSGDSVVMLQASLVL
jgi:hypothetical protein